MASKAWKPIEIGKQDALRVLQKLQIDGVPHLKNIHIIFKKNQSTYEPQVLIQTDNYQVYGYGSNRSGILGTGSKKPISGGVPQLIEGLNNKRITQIALSETHGLALCYDGEVLSWGANDKGQLGDGTFKRRMHPDKVSFDMYQDVVEMIACSQSISCALTKRRMVYVWGSNASGGLGTMRGDFISNRHPEVVDLTVPLTSKVVSIHCNAGTVLAITNRFELHVTGRSCPCNNHIENEDSIHFSLRKRKQKEILSFCATPKIYGAILIDGKENGRRRLWVWGDFKPAISEPCPFENGQISEFVDLTPYGEGFAAIGVNGRSYIFKPGTSSQSPIVADCLLGHTFAAPSQGLKLSFKVIEAPPSTTLNNPHDVTPFASSEMRGDMLGQQKEIKEISYRMDHSRRGQCLIFNQVNFPKHTGLTTRHGSDKDAEYLNQVFGILGFDVSVWKDLTKDQIYNKLEKARTADHDEADCFVCCILTHGGKGDILYASDGRWFKLTHVLRKFYADQCSTLAMKPKVFIIQACRGPKVDQGVQVTLAVDGDQPVAEVRIPRYGDLLVCHSSYPKHVSIRNTSAGSWFIQELCKAIEDHGIPAPGKRVFDFATIITMAQGAVAHRYEAYRFQFKIDHQLPKKVKTDDQSMICKQMPIYESTLVKRLYFWPKSRSLGSVGDDEPIYT